MIKLRGFWGKHRVLGIRAGVSPRWPAWPPHRRSRSMRPARPWSSRPPSRQGGNTIDSISYGRFGQPDQQWLAEARILPDGPVAGRAFPQPLPGARRIRLHPARELWRPAVGLQGRPLLHHGRLSGPPDAVDRHEDHLRRLLGRGKESGLRPGGRIHAFLPRQGVNTPAAFAFNNESAGRRDGEDRAATSRCSS
jgi:hypothetical protein